MGAFRPVDRLELVETDGRPALAPFRPRRSRRLDSDDYPGLLLRRRRQSARRAESRDPALHAGWCEASGLPHIPLTVRLRSGAVLSACRRCWTRLS